MADTGNTTSSSNPTTIASMPIPAPRLLIVSSSLSRDIAGM
jgi:hypothetical protein